MYESSKTAVLLEGENQIRLQLSKAWPRVVIYPPYLTLGAHAQRGLQ